MVKTLNWNHVAKNFKTTDYTDKHRYEEVGTQDIRGANGAGKTKNSASKLARFSLFFLPIPAYWDRLPCSRIARSARELLTIKYAACI